MINIENLLADRIGGKDFVRMGEYKMECVKSAKRRAQDMFPERIFLDMGIGEPDGMAPKIVIDELYHQAKLPNNHVYADNGCQEFRTAVATYMSEKFEVSLNDRTEIVHCIGAKSALSLLPLCFINSGDIAISTQPCYPIFDVHVKYMGGKIFSLPLLRENDYLPDLSMIPEEIAQKAKIITLNYPNNPTSAPATYEFFESLINFAKKYNILIINDAAYASLVIENPLSILQVPGSKDISIEIHSMSKAYNMTGWRLGWVCGNEFIVKAFSLVKNNSDSGQFLSIQKAAIKALQDPDFPQKMAQKYIRRKKLIANILQSVGFDVFSSSSGFFLFMKMPQAVRYKQREIVFSTAETFAHWLLESLGIVGIGWEDPEPSIRFSMTFHCQTEKEFAEMLAERLSGITIICSNYVNKKPNIY